MRKWLLVPVILLGGCITDPKVHTRYVSLSCTEVTDLDYGETQWKCVPKDTVHGN